MAFENVAESPSIAFDAPVNLVTQNVPGGATLLNFPGAFNAGTQLFPVAQFQTVLLRYVPNAVMTSITITLSWFPYDTIPVGGSAVDTLGVDQFVWQTGIWGDRTELTKLLPCRGSGLFMSINRAGGIAANVDFLRLWGSNREINPSARLASDQINNGATRTLIATQQVINAGLSALFTPTVRYDGLARVGWSAFGGAAVNPGALVVHDGSGRTLGSVRDPGAVDGGLNRNFQLPMTFTAPRNSWYCEIFNLGAANVTYDISCIASPEG